MNIKYDFANMALEGGKPLEAMKIFMEIVSEENNASAWCGLGASKFNLIYTDDSTVQEVMFCYKKAKLLEPNMFKEIEDAFVENAIVCINQLNELRILAERKKKEEKKSMRWAAVTTAVAATIGSSNTSNGFTQLSSLAVSGAGINQIISSMEGTEQMNILLENSQVYLKQLNDLSLSFLVNNITKEKFIKGFNSIENIQNKISIEDTIVDNNDILKKLNLPLKFGYDRKKLNNLLLDKEVTKGVFNHLDYKFSDKRKVSDYYLFKDIDDTLILIGRIENDIFNKEFKKPEYSIQYKKGGFFSIDCLIIKISNQVNIKLFSDFIPLDILKSF